MACSYVDFGAVARNLIGIQCQYASRYILGEGGEHAYPG